MLSCHLGSRRDHQKNSSQRHLRGFGSTAGTHDGYASLSDTFQPTRTAQCSAAAMMRSQAG